MYFKDIFISQDIFVRDMFYHKMYKNKTFLVLHTYIRIYIKYI